ncbi:hypothetical protein GCM10009118_30870 [Wandonia haliotis]|uniref:Inner membrane protein YgaP-like transmembrane domain-containing protein n=1 Tax=Wandonia haliotis TaxID=574963 RepID=A0ABN1MTP4_9FLAO
MKKNMGNIDKGIRIVVALLLLLAIYMELVTTPWSIILLVVAGVLVLTSFLNFCPLYTLFGINTCKTEQK